MSGILTFTINPCIDKSTSIARLQPEKKLRCEKPRFEPGGGGVNVSRAIKRLGGNCVTVIVRGGYSGIFLKELLAKEGISIHSIDIIEHTRENLIVYEELSGNQYRFGMPGPQLTENEWMQCLEIPKQFKDISYVVASGSLPRGVPDDFYGQLAKRAKAAGKKFILDTSGTAIGPALQEGVYLWKPNLGELSAFSGYTDLNESSAVVAARSLIEKNMAEVIVVSMGAAGALLITKNITERVIPPIVKVVSTVGAGDSMVGGIVLSLSKGKSLVDAVRFGILCGTATTTTPGTELCTLAQVEALGKIHSW